MAVYLDYNATTPVDCDVQKEIISVLKKQWANPSSSYSIGKDAKSIVESSREAIADMIGARSEEIVFTSGGTESNNMVIKTILKDFTNHNYIMNNKEADIPHIITSNIEHDSVALPLKVLAKDGKASVSFVPVSKLTGAIDVTDVLGEIRPNTRLITIMLANNETGIIQPVSLISNCIKSSKRYKSQRIFIHTDAAQAVGKINVDVTELGVDYLTVVGHKFYGPRIGAVYFRKSCPLYPLMYGGGQEQSYRPGTENTCMIAGLGLASLLVTKNLKDYNLHMNKIRDYLEECLKTEFEDKVIFNVPPSLNRLPNTTSVAFDYDNITGKDVLNEAHNIFASTGAACHSSGKVSTILIAFGIEENIASRTLRLSVGRETTKEDIDTAVNHLKDAIFKLTQGKK